MSPVPPDCASLAFSSGGSGLNVTDRWGAGEELAISRFEHFADLLERVVQHFPAPRTRPLPGSQMRLYAESLSGDT